MISSIMKFLFEYKAFFIEGLINTITLSLSSVVIGVIFGVILALMKISSNKALKSISSIYTNLIRGTPLLIQLTIVNVFLDVPLKVVGLIALSINSSAYVSEIIRSGIESIDKGQMEAARSLGLSYSFSMRLIILPQAIKNIVPVLGNEFIAILKESSMVSVIGVADLMYSVDVVRAISYDPKTPLMIVFILYFIMTSILTRGVSIIERRLKVSDTSK